MFGHSLLVVTHIHRALPIGRVRHVVVCIISEYRYLVLFCYSNRITKV